MPRPDFPVGFLESRLREAYLLLTAIVLVACGSGRSTDAIQGADAGTWQGAWAAAPHQPVSQSDVSFRMIVRPTLGGDRLRLRFSNAYGSEPTRIGAVSIAKRSTGPAVDPDSLQPVSFAGQPAVAVPAGTEIISDPLDFSWTFGEELAISFHVAEASDMDQHGNAVAVGYSGSGNLTMDASGTGYGNAVTSFFSVMGLDVDRPDATGTVVALGDSITDGGNPPEINNRWPDYLAERLHEAGLVFGVLNEGIGANQVTRDTEFLGFSEAAVSRFERDVLQRPGLRTVVLFEGTNDLAGGVLAAEIFDGLADMATRAQSAGVRTIIGTITPRGSSALWTEAMEQQRVLLNQMLRDAVGGPFDALADFDLALANPLAPNLMAPQFDSGDGLHPNPLGLQEIAATIPLEAL